MKNFLVTLLAIACFAILIAGNVRWNSLGTEDESNNNVVAVKPPKNTAASKQPESAVWEFEKATINWPAESRESFRNAMEDKRPFKIVLAGSDALGKDPNGWAFLLKNELLSTFGEKNLEVTVIENNTSTRKALAADWQSELSSAAPDMVVLEPLLLNDNGEVFIEESLTNITKIIEDVKAENPDTAFILQPGNPIFKPKYYLTQVETLKSFAEEKGWDYLNHWEEWPDPNSEEIKTYIDQRTSLPTAAGHTLWGEYLIDYFTGK
ncbi:SGNH/GDSL hydrolase family protein [Bacillus sp. FJAT-27445]|uniref:SGNH/GDSL hydrolase family protein n=1 Tax=Bacillus sp. FJAT-27445 TaxID=1679166 RepID=UPI0007435560|nr:SGNH/GDSL hydrolase family protein [Bacillus sp. FJAT-27445]